MARRVHHEITLLAWTRDAETGDWCLLDIVETSRHFASHFTRKWMKMAEVKAISALRPCVTWDFPARREIRRAE